MKNNNPKKGFTLIELLVVIAIISVLSGVVMQSLSSTRSKSRDAVRLQSIESIAKGFQVATTGANGNQFPTSGGIYACLGVTAGTTCWEGPLTTYNGNTAVNTVLKSGLAGSIIPSDPLYLGVLGDKYLYHSNLTPASQPNGAYLSWKREGTSCGRGVVTGATCVLYIGPPTP